MLGKRLIKSGADAAGGFVPSEHFETVTYTGNGGTQRIGGYINRGGVFNGSSSRINTTITTNYSNLSISCWVNFSALPTGGADATLVSKGYYNSATDNQYIHLRYEDFTDQFTFGIRQNSTYNLQATSGVTASINTWYHVVGTLDSSGNAQIYVNGVAGTGITSAPTMTNSNEFQIGSFINTVALINGKIDQVRIFNKELSSSEVTTLYNETYASSTVSTTDIFNDDSGIALYQLDGNANDTGGVSGKFGEGGIFNGSSSYIYNTNTAIWSSNVSISAWFKTSNNSQRNPIVQIGRGSWTNGFELQVPSANTIGFSFAEGTKYGYFNSSINLNDGNWHHYVQVSNSTTANFI